MNFENIIHPITNKRHNIYSKEGKELIKNYVKLVQSNTTNTTNTTNKDIEHTQPVTRESFDEFKRYINDLRPLKNKLNGYKKENIIKYMELFFNRLRPIFKQIPKKIDYERIFEYKQKGGSNSFTSEDVQECSICLVPLDESATVSLHEGDVEHRFHSECIRKLFNSGSTLCPLCREQITTPEALALRSLQAKKIDATKYLAAVVFFVNMLELGVDRTNLLTKLQELHTQIQYCNTSDELENLENKLENYFRKYEIIQNLQGKWWYKPLSYLSGTMNLQTTDVFETVLPYIINELNNIFNSFQY